MKSEEKLVVVAGLGQGLGVLLFLKVFLPALLQRGQGSIDITEIYWQLIQQPKSTWTHEFDFRPASESF